ncbi:MAG: acyl-CoA thioesterase [Candidatus Dadabacteria bacterium]|nr:acyl-CoA thioesterase [Candidatus Dadabacteria bacterium]
MGNELVKESVEVSNSELVFPTHTNHYGTIFGGRVLELMDMTGVLAAMRFAGQNTVTASIEAVDFKKPVKVGDIMEVKARVIYTAHTSMVVKVDVYKVGKYSPGAEFTCRGYLVFVAIDPDGKPIPVPTLKVVTEEDKKYWKIGEEVKNRFKLRQTKEEK